MILKRFDQARSQAKLAQRLDPVSFAINEGKEIVDLYPGRVEEAQAEARNLRELYPNSDLRGMMRAIALEELHRRDTPARASFARVSTLLARRPVVDARLDRVHLAALNQQWPDAKRRYEDIVRLSLSTYIPSTILSMLKGAVYGFKGEMFEVAYKEHDPSLLWCGYLEVTAGSDLPEVIRKMGLQ